MAALHENHPPIISGGGLKALKVVVKILMQIARFASLGLVSLTSQIDNHHEVLRENLDEELIDIALGDPRYFLNLDSLGNPQDVEPDTPRSKGDYEFLREHMYDRDARRYAVLALGNLAITPECHEKLITEKALEAFKSCLDVEDDETRFNASYAVNKLASVEENLELLETLGSSSFD